jgi:hypothetical protein
LIFHGIKLFQYVVAMDNEILDNNCKSDGQLKNPSQIALRTCKKTNSGISRVEDWCQVKKIFLQSLIQ